MAESIYNWLEEEEVQQVKQPMYRSKHSFEPPSGSFAGNKKKAGTMGRICAKPDPTNFMRAKKNRKSSDLPKPRKYVRKDAPTRKPGVPRRNEAPVMGLTTTKNFVVANAVENILAVPAQRNTSKADYLGKKDYGRVPNYLRQVKKDIQNEKAVIEAYFDEQEVAQEEGHLLPAEERRMLCQQLKVKWDDTNKKYQKITHNVNLDTIGKVKRKEQYEKTLDQLEKDIRLLSSKRPIVIVGNSNSTGFY